MSKRPSRYPGPATRLIYVLIIVGIVAIVAVSIMLHLDGSIKLERRSAGPLQTDVPPARLDPK